MNPLLLVAAGLVALLVMVPVVAWLAGFVRIREDQVGIVVKRFAGRSLPAGRLIALEGEAGYQADTLAPGCHFGYWPWQYAVQKVPMTVVAPGEIALVLAADGAPIPPERILGKVVASDDFQNARRFLTGGGSAGGSWES
jgi:uncharacterized membrane protein YqiK